MQLMPTDVYVVMPHRPARAKFVRTIYTKRKAPKGRRVARSIQKPAARRHAEVWAEIIARLKN